MAAANSWPRLPNLFVVGAPKCGTTAWVEYLRTHPEIFIPKAKERCYFALDLPNFRLTRTAEDYAELFAGAGEAKVVGEASAMYLFSEAAAAAIHEHDPGSKILIFLREQEDYLPSLHNQFLWEFAEEIEDFETAWRRSGQRPVGTVPAGCLEPRTLDYKAMGRFGEQVARYLAVFPVEQVRVIWFRDWVADPRSTYLDILGFLGLEDDGRSDFPPINQGMTYDRGDAGAVGASARRGRSEDVRAIKSVEATAVSRLPPRCWNDCLESRELARAGLPQATSARSCASKSGILCRGQSTARRAPETTIVRKSQAKRGPLQWRLTRCLRKSRGRGEAGGAVQCRPFWTGICEIYRGTCPDRAFASFTCCSVLLFGDRRC